MANLVNDPGVKSGQSFLRGGTSGGSSGSSSGNFSDVFKGIGTLVDLVDKNRQTDLANSVAKISVNESADLETRDPTQGGTKDGNAWPLPEATPATGLRSEQQDRTTAEGSVFSTPTTVGGSAPTAKADVGSLVSGVQGVGQLKSISEAFRQGKFTETERLARTTVAMRNLINANPGKEAQIIEIARSTMGYDPFKKYQEAYYKEQNEQQKVLKEADTKWEATKTAGAGLGIPAAVLLKGDSNPQYRSVISAEILNRTAQNATLEQRKKQLEMSTANRTAGQNDAYDLAQRETDNQISNIFSDGFASATGGVSYSGIQKKMQEAGSDGTYSPQELQEVKTMFTQFKQKALLSFSQTMNNPWGDDKLSYAARIGDKSKLDALQSRFNERISVIEDAITNKDFGMLAWEKNRIEAIKQGDEAAIQMSSDMFRKLQVLPPEVRQHYTVQNTDKLLTEVQAVRLPVIGSRVANGEPLGKVLTENKLPDTGHNAVVINQSINGAVKTILDPKVKPEIVMGTAESVFGEKNLDFMSQFNEKSKATVFNKFTSPEVTARMLTLGKENPQLLNNYKRWVFQNSTNLMKVSADTIKAHVTDSEGFLQKFITGSGSVNDKFPITFNGREFAVSVNNAEVSKEGAYTLQSLARGFVSDKTKEAVNQLNSVYRNVLPLLEGTKEDPQTFLKLVLGDSGILDKIQKVDPAQASTVTELPQEQSVDRNGTSITTEAGRVLSDVGGAVGSVIGDAAKNARDILSEKASASPVTETPKISVEASAEIERLKTEANTLSKSNPAAAREMNARIGKLQAGYPVSESFLTADEATKLANGEDVVIKPYKDSAPAKEGSQGAFSGERLKKAFKDSDMVPGRPSKTYGKNSVVKDVQSGKTRDPVVENALRAVQDGSQGQQAAAEKQLSDLSVVKEAKVNSSDNFSIRYRPSQRVRQQYKGLDWAKVEPTTKGLLDAISKPESGGNYNIISGGKNVNLTSMTIGQVMGLQSALINSKATPSSASGKYQIIGKTLKGLVQELGLSKDTLFNEETQDKLGYRLLQKRGLDSFLSGKIDEDAFIERLSMEWAALPSVSKGGRSYYAGDGTGFHEKSINLDKFREMIKKMRK